MSYETVCVMLTIGSICFWSYSIGRSFGKSYLWATLFTVFHEFDRLWSEWFWRKRRVIILYRMTVYTALELHSFFSWFSALTESEIFLRGKICPMDESFIEKSFHDTIECRLIHLARIDKFRLQCSEWSRLLLFEKCEDMSAMNSGKHKKTTEKNLELYYAFFCKCKFLYFLNQKKSHRSEMIIWGHRHYNSSYEHRWYSIHMGSRAWYEHHRSYHSSHRNWLSLHRLGSHDHTGRGISHALPRSSSHGWVHPHEMHLQFGTVSRDSSGSLIFRLVPSSDQKK